QNLLEQMENDSLSEFHQTNIYYPFADKTEWQLTSWITSTSLTQQETEKFLKLDYFKAHPTSFKSAHNLCACIEALPEVPWWKHQTITVNNAHNVPYQTNSPLILYWHNGLEVAAHLFSNPVFAQCLELKPYRLYDTTDAHLCVYGEYMSGDHAWDYQSTLPEGHSFLGIICASDKTPLTIGTGNCEMHPIFLSLANIDANV
ncbi:hypothetical protein L208DRAFT_1058103, partial [Tricholoma matsutake]